MEDLGPGRGQGPAAGGLFGPDQAGAVLGQGQDGEGAGRQEMLVRHAVVGPGQLDRRHHPDLGIGPAHRADPGFAPDQRAASVRAHHQGGLHRAAIFQAHERTPGRDLQPRHPRRRQHLDLGGRHLLGQGRADVAVLDQISERFTPRASSRSVERFCVRMRAFKRGCALRASNRFPLRLRAQRAIGDFRRVETQEGRQLQPRRRAWRAAVGDQDLLDRLGRGGQPLAHAQRPPLPEARKRHRRGPAIEGRGDLGVEGRRVDEDRLQPAAFERERQGGAGHAGSSDEDVAGDRSGHGRDMRPRRAPCPVLRASFAVNAP